MLTTEQKNIVTSRHARHYFSLLPKDITNMIQERLLGGKEVKRGPWTLQRELAIPEHTKNFHIYKIISSSNYLIVITIKENPICSVFDIRTHEFIRQFKLMHYYGDYAITKDDKIICSVSNTISFLDLEGKVLQIFNVPDITKGIALDSKDNIFVGSSDNKNVIMYNTSGQFIKLIKLEHVADHNREFFIIDDTDHICYYTDQPGCCTIDINNGDVRWGSFPPYNRVYSTFVMNNKMAFDIMGNLIYTTDFSVKLFGIEDDCFKATERLNQLTVDREGRIYAVLMSTTVGIGRILILS